MSKGSSSILTPTGSPLLTRQTTMPSSTPPSPKDFEMPCRNFKSSFARSLSMNNGGNYQCKSLDYNPNNQYRYHHNHQHQQQQQQYNDNNNNSYMNQDENYFKENQNFNENFSPLPENLKRSLKRSSSQHKNFHQQELNGVISGQNNIKNNNDDMVSSPSPSPPPPALPARRSLPVNNVDIKNNKNLSNKSILAKVSYNQHEQNQNQNHQQDYQEQQQQQNKYHMTQFKENSNDSCNNINNKNNNNNNNNNNSIIQINNKSNANNLIASHGSFNNKISYHMQQYPQMPQQHHHHYHYQQHHQQQQQQQQQQQHHQQHRSLNSNFNANVVVVWPKNNEEQDFNYNDDDDDDDDETEHGSGKTASTLPDITAMEVPTPPSALLTTPLSKQIKNDQQIQLQLHQHHQHPQHQHHQHQQHHHQCPQQRPLSFEVHHDQPGNSQVNLEALFLQNEMDSMQWHLKQVETNCEMYRAVLQEVARFLERFSAHKSQMQQTTRTNMERSKSLYHVYSYNDKENNKMTRERVQSPTPNYLRARSSTNLIDLKPLTKNSNKQNHVADTKNKCNDTMSPYSYEGYKDFTWRRSPKKLAENQKNSAHEKMEEKLNKEAFRLSRTIQNVLNVTADMTHRNNLSRMSRTPSGSTMTLNMPPIHNSTSLTLVENNTSDAGSNDSSASFTSSTSPHMMKSSNQLNNNNNVDILFVRANNNRESRLSLRSSTDSSVHSSTSFSATSTASSKAETDEDLHQHGGYLTHSNRGVVGTGGNGTLTPSGNAANSAIHLIGFNNMMTRPSLGGNGFSTEDESGFSSINSFQDIGVPLSSTLLSNIQPADSPRLSLNLGNDKKTSNKKLTATAGTASLSSASSTSSNTPVTSNPSSGDHPSNVVGVPLPGNGNSAQQNSRWDTNIAKTKNPQKSQRLSMPCLDDTATVHWV